MLALLQTLLQITDTFKVDMCSKRGTSRSHYMSILSWREVEEKDVELITATKAAKWLTAVTPVDVFKDTSGYFLFCGD